MCEGFKYSREHLLRKGRGSHRIVSCGLFYLAPGKLALENTLPILLLLRQAKISPLFNLKLNLHSPLQSTSSMVPTNADSGVRNVLQWKLHIWEYTQASPLLGLLLPMLT